MTNDEQENEYTSVEVIEKRIIQATCFRCGETWIPKTGNIEPKRCAKCNSPYWNKPRLRTGDVASPNKYGFDQWELGKWYLMPKFATADGNIDMARNETRWRSLAQYARRRGCAAQFDGNKGPMYARIVKLKAS